MYISIRLAQSIVETLRDTIKQDINFINNDGIIIASTDLSRINSLHKAAIECVNQGKTIAINYDEEYEGAKKGVNLPVRFQNEIIGVIGISGDLNIVEKYGNIIKKMTEILLKEEWIKENIYADIENKKIIIESVINSSGDNLELIPSFVGSKPKKFAVADLNLIKLDYNGRRNLIRFSESNFDHDLIYSTIIQNRFISLYIDCDDQVIDSHLKKITTHFKKHYDLDLNFGISNSYHKLKNSNRYYKEAIRASKWVKNKKDSNLLFYKDMDLGLILTSIDEKDQLLYSYKILKNISQEDISFYQKLFDLYSKHNGSINKIAKNMYMHKNSIQYRIEKLKDLTGYDLRNINDYIVLWFAFFAIKK